MAEGYSITTYKLQLTYRHPEWFQATQALFHQVMSFYYALLQQEDTSVLELSNQNLLRHLEQRTIKGRDGKEPEIPLPYAKVPLYFRRAAINSAIAQARSLHAQVENWKQNPKGKQPQAPESPKANMVYYKGMYKDFDREHQSIQLKLYNGAKWEWETYHFTGRAIPKDGDIMSPTIVQKGKSILLHLPVKTRVQDARTAKERAKARERYITVNLTNSDTLAVCLTTEADGTSHSPLFIKGGKALAHKRRQLRGRAKQCEASGRQKYYDKITRITDHMAHQVSRQIVDYAVRQGAKLIVVPKYSEDFARQGKAFLHQTPFDFIGRRIVTDVTYKAWQQGIVIQPSSIGSNTKTCALCGEPIKRYNKPGQTPSAVFYGGKNYICPNGHKGNTALNTTRNLAQSFYESFMR